MIDKDPFDDDFFTGVKKKFAMGAVAIVAFYLFIIAAICAVILGVLKIFGVF